MPGEGLNGPKSCFPMDWGVIRPMIQFPRGILTLEIACYCSPISIEKVVIFETLGAWIYASRGVNSLKSPSHMYHEVTSAFSA